MIENNRTHIGKYAARIAQSIVERAGHSYHGDHANSTFSRDSARYQTPGISETPTINGVPSGTGEYSRYAQHYHAHTHSKTRAITIIVAALALVAILLVLATTRLLASQPTSAAESTWEYSFASGIGANAASVIEKACQPATTDYIEGAITVDAVKTVSGAEDAPEAFSLVDGAEPNIEENALAAVAAAAAAITDTGKDVGFVFISLSDGTGIAYNADEYIYGASSFKGPYACYVYETLADTEAGASGVSSSTLNLVSNAVEYSDNKSYSRLRNAYDSSGFASWLEECGVDSAIEDDTHYPRYSARQSALLWLHTYHYLQTGTDAANTLAEHYANTSVSFIRDGIAGLDDSAAVMNKAGWIASSTRFSGTCDAGIIETDDGAYLMSIMTSQADSSAAEERVGNVAAALFQLRDQL